MSIKDEAVEDAFDLITRVHGDEYEDRIRGVLKRLYEKAYDTGYDSGYVDGGGSDDDVRWTF